MDMVIASAFESVQFGGLVARSANDAVCVYVCVCVLWGWVGEKNRFDARFIRSCQTSMCCLVAAEYFSTKNAVTLKTSSIFSDNFLWDLCCRSVLRVQRPVCRTLEN